MRFGVLGSVALIDGTGHHELRSLNSRTLLGALLLNARTTVPTSELSWTLWGFEQPTHPRRATQLAVARLRAALRPFGGPHLLQTRSDGYRLDVAEEDIDVSDFEVALREADLAWEAGDSARELRALENALSAWRGDALADVPAQSLTAERMRLNEQRLQTIERRIDVRMNLGRAEGLLGELRELTTRHPNREHVWYLYVLALHESGRRSEALSEYELIRRRLADQFGTEPGPELRALHPRLLGGPALEDAARGPSGRVPRQLPRVPARCLRRKRELARLNGLIPSPHESTPVVATVTGPPGIGKSALVAHWARRAADAFPDGQIWVDLRGSEAGRSLRTEDALGWLLRGLGASPSSWPRLQDERAAMLRSLTDGLRLLIVLDDVESAEHALPLLPGAGGSMVVATSRGRLPELTLAAGAHAVRLDRLAPLGKGRTSPGTGPTCQESSQTSGAGWTKDLRHAPSGV